MPEYSTQSESFDTHVAIVGGGMVGMAMALSLAQNNIPSVLIESLPSDSFLAEKDGFDDRTLVINPASHQFWQNLGVWTDIQLDVTPINHVHVSNQGKFGVVHFDKDELEVAQLGHVVAAKTLSRVLFEHVEKNQLIKTIQPAKLLDFEIHKDHVELTVEQREDNVNIMVKLMVAADGVKSNIRSKLNLATEIKSYQRTAVICNVKTDQQHLNRAFERLTQHGPMALLPFGNASEPNRFGFVWSMDSDQAESMLTIDEESFLELAQQQFGHRAGAFQLIGRRSSYPLYQVKVPTQYSERVVLMGNAAHAVSPVSAQGLNLAVRGISRLSHVLNKVSLNGDDLGAKQVLQAYQQASLKDQERTMNYTDDLMTWFKIDEPMINGIRSLGLVAINSNVTLKNALFKTAGGLR